MTVDDLCRLHNSACEFVGKGLPQYGEEFVARMANHATAFSIAVSASAEQDVSIVDTNATVSVGEGDQLPGEQDTSSVHADASTSELAEESQGLQEQGEGNDFDVIVKYFAAPALGGKTLILTDPMLATGKTLENVLNALKDHGQPKQIHIISVIGSTTGIEYVKSVFPENTHLWIAAVDDELTSKGYIIPGLGDAGDLSYGSKL